MCFGQKGRQRKGNNASLSKLSKNNHNFYINLALTLLVHFLWFVYPSLWYCTALHCTALHCTTLPLDVPIYIYIFFFFTTSTFGGGGDGRGGEEKIKNKKIKCCRPFCGSGKEKSIDATIRIGWEILCLPFMGFFLCYSSCYSSLLVTTPIGLINGGHY